ncbi:MAG: Holliday junction resolvase RuvX [Deltaproteobacteria bacterium]|nr:Holliday junction resolvase RuvX [Deltaproteobacteria bacterium]
MKERVLCLDVGDKRIGVAVSDPLGMTAQSLVTIARRHFKEDCARLLKLAEEYEVQKIVIGLPLNSEGNEGPQAKKVRFFGEGLTKFLKEKEASITIEWWDESLTSQEAEAILLEADLSRKKRRKVVDKLAASLILQRYLDHHA